MDLMPEDSTKTIEKTRHDLPVNPLEDMTLGLIAISKGPEAASYFCVNSVMTTRSPDYKL